MARAPRRIHWVLTWLFLFIVGGVAQAGCSCTPDPALSPPHRPEPARTFAGLSAVARDHRHAARAGEPFRGHRRQGVEARKKREEVKKNGSAGPSGILKASA